MCVRCKVLCKHLTWSSWPMVSRDWTLRSAIFVGTSGIPPSDKLSFAKLVLPLTRIRCSPDLKKRYQAYLFSVARGHVLTNASNFLVGVHNYIAIIIPVVLKIFVVESCVIECCVKRPGIMWIYACKWFQPAVGLKNVGNFFWLVENIA